jgi:hypothetical protein
MVERTRSSKVRRSPGTQPILIGERTAISETRPMVLDVAAFNDLLVICAPIFAPRQRAADAKFCSPLRRRRDDCK